MARALRLPILLLTLLTVTPILGLEADRESEEILRQSVLNNYWEYTVAKEGYVPFPYCDQLNLVTTAIGNLIDAGPNYDPPGATPAQRARLNNVVSAAAMAPAMRMPWKRRAPGWTRLNPIAGELVTAGEIAEAWTTVKRENERTPDFAQRGGVAYIGLTNITLDVEYIKKLFFETLRDFNNTLARKYPGFEEWPADAQRATLSMAWAMGPNFSFPAFKAAVDRKDFAAAAEQSFFRGGGGTWDKRAGRNLENYEMFQIADGVIRMDMDPEPLRWDDGITPRIPTAPAVAENPTVTSPFYSSVAPNPRIGRNAFMTAGAATGIGAACYGAWRWLKGRR